MDGLDALVSGRRKMEEEEEVGKVDPETERVQMKTAAKDACGFIKSQLWTLELVTTLLHRYIR